MSNELNAQLTFRVSQEVYDFLDEEAARFAEEYGVQASKSAVARNIITMAMRASKGKAPKPAPKKKVPPKPSRKKAR